MSTLSGSDKQDFAALDGAKIRVKADSGEAIYEMTRLRDPGQLAPVTMSFCGVQTTRQNRKLPEKLVLKTPCFEGLRPEDCDARIAAVKARFESESDSLSRLSTVDSVPNAYAGKAFWQAERLGDDKEVTPALLRHYVDGINLAKWMEQYAKDHRQPFFQGIKNVDDWFAIAAVLVDSLEAIHHQRVVHGDLRPENIIVTANNGAIPKSGEIKLINTEEDDSVANALRNIPLEGVFRRKYDCPSKLFEKSKPDGEAGLRNAEADWYAPTDVFSLGAVLLELACGRLQPLTPFLYEEPVTFPPDRPERVACWSRVLAYEERKSDRQLKDFVLKAVKEKHDKLAAYLRITEVIMACTRTQPETQTSDLRSVRLVLDQFPNPATSNSSQTDLGKLLERETTGLCDPIRAVIRRRADLMQHDLQTLKAHKLLRLSGSRAHLVDVLITVLRSLRKGDLCRVVTTPTFFFDGNMGPFGRITSALYLASDRGAEIDWILVVDERSLRDRHVAEVLEAQREGAEWVKNQSSFKMQFAVTSTEMYRRIHQHKLTFIEAGPKDNPDKTVLIAPDYRGDSGNISVLRLWSGSGSGPRVARRLDFDKIFDFLCSRARPVARYKR